MILALVAVGFLSIAAQVVILRELNVAFFGVELIYLIAFALWLLWTAVGAFLSPRAPAPNRRTVAVLFTVTALFLPAVIIMLRGIRILWGAVPGAYLALGHQLLATAGATLPMALLTGLLFSWIARIYIAEGSGRRTLAAAYAIESLGGLMGGLAATVALMAGMANLVLGLLCALFSCAVAITIHVTPRGTIPLRRPEAYAMVGAAVFLVAILPFSPKLDITTSRWSQPHATFVKDSAYGRITVAGGDGMAPQVSVFENGALVADSEGMEGEVFCHLAALQHQHPARVLILGGAATGLLREILKHAPTRVDYVELDPVMLAVTRTLLPGDIGSSLSDPRVHPIVDDPRRYLDRGATYDLILVGMAEPTSGQTNRFYTEEFFQLCFRALKPGGIVALRLQGAENFWTPPLAMKMASIHKALHTVFPQVLVLPGNTNIVTASPATLPSNPEIMNARWRERGITSRLINPAYIAYLFHNDRRHEVAVRLAATPAPQNSDLRPVCFRYNALVWLSKFIPAINTEGFISRLERAATTVMMVTLIGLVLAIALAGVRRRRLQPPLLAGVAGFTGMVTETTVIMYYQVKVGVLYQDMGLLLMSFMAGLALGSWSLRKGKTPLMVINALFIVTPLFTLLVGGAVCLGILYHLFAVMLILFVSGFLVGALFAAASYMAPQTPPQGVGILYGADILGGCAGALMSGLFLIPFLGLPVTLGVAFFVSLTLPLAIPHICPLS